MKKSRNPSVTRVKLIALTTAGLVIMILVTAPASSVAPQGKGGQVVAKPTPTPKKAATRRTTATRTTNNSKTNQPTKPAREAATAAEMIFWNSIKDSTNAEDFKAYLKKYPDGEFAELAANRLKAFESAKSSTDKTPANPTNPNSADSGKTDPASSDSGSKTGRSTNPPGTIPGSTNPGAPKTAGPPNPPLPLHSFDFVTVTLDKDGKVKSRETKGAQAYTEDLGGGVKMEMVAVPPGEFTMGSPDNEPLRNKNEGPQHRVRINYWFYLGKLEVTAAQFRAIMGPSPPGPAYRDENPIEHVSWDEAVEFCRRLSARTGREYRLPSEAEWEYAARAGTTTPYAFGERVTPEIVADNSEWVNGKYQPPNVRAAGSTGIANAFGLYDMHGNVLEWCQDRYHESYSDATSDAPTDGSPWLIGGEQNYRVLRGGGYGYSTLQLRSAERSKADVGRFSRYRSIGFRVVAVARAP